MEHIYIKVVKDMKDFGKMICSMEQGQKSWRMEANMRGYICLAKNMDLVSINGLMDQYIMGPGEKIILKVLVNISGPTGDVIKANGKII